MKLIFIFSDLMKEKKLKQNCTVAEPPNATLQLAIVMNVDRLFVCFYVCESRYIIFVIFVAP